MMDEVIADLKQQGILRPQRITSAYRCFLVPKADQSARFIIDLSPLTPLYRVPHITLYSAARVLSTIQPFDKMIKTDLTAGFFQVPLCRQHQHFYGVYYREQQLALTRLPMGHPMAPYVLQRLAKAVAHHINNLFGTSMVAYLDDWLFFQPDIPAHHILQELHRLGFTVNQRKSILQPTSRLVYLGLDISALSQQLRPTPAYIHHMMQLIQLVPDASPLDLRRIVGYISWLAWSMNWPTFLATHLLQREPYWITWCQRKGLLDLPRTMGTIRRSILIYTDATQTSFGVHVATTPPQQIYQQFTDAIPIAQAEIAASLFALIWVGSRLRQPTAITISTDSTVAYYTLATGKGYTFRHSIWLQILYIHWFQVKMNRGHGLVVRWVPSTANPADPVSRGVLLTQQAGRL
jgi:hypothetical protein